MDARKRFATEFWRLQALPLGMRLIELEEKAQDWGLSEEETREYGVVKREYDRLNEGYFTEMFKP